MEQPIGDYYASYFLLGRPGVRAVFDVVYGHGDVVGGRQLYQIVYRVQRRFFFKSPSFSASPGSAGVNQDNKIKIDKGDRGENGGILHNKSTPYKSYPRSKKKIQCVGRESNPGLVDGNDRFNSRAVATEAGF